MRIYFKHLLFSLFASLTLSILVTHNYNYSKVHEQALISQPIYIQTRPVPNAQHKVYMPQLIDSFQLKKYQLKDTNYEVQQQELSADDQFLLFNMDPPKHFFSQESIYIDSYQLLQLRKFSLRVSNPSKKFRICVSEIVSDRLEVRRQDERGILPLCLQPQEKYNFSFAFYAAWLNPQYVQGAIYFFIQIYDEKILAQEKVYARKILVNITPNHFRIQTPVFRNCPRHNAVMLKNYQIFEICVSVEGKKKFETMEGTLLDVEKCIGPTKSIKILLEGKTNQMLIHTRGPASQPAFPSLFLQTLCEQTVTLDYFNIGILPQQRTIFEYPLTMTSTRSDNVTIQQIIIQSSSQTITFEEMPVFKGVVGPSAKNLQIGLLKILARKQPERKSVINIKIRISTVLEQFWTSQKYIYQQLRNPISAGPRRFIDLRKPQGNSQRFSLKNNLNIPIFITKLFYDEQIMELSWIGSQRRKIVPPNHSIQELAFKYIGPKQIRLSPQKHILMIQLNGNIMVPIEIVLYDQSLQCLIDNQAKRCVNVSFLDFGYFRDQKSKSKQIVLRNWNPQGLPVSLEVPAIQSKQNNINFSMQIFGPLPSDQLYINDHNYKDFFLKTNHFMVINIIMQPMENATSVSLPFIILTNQQVIRITLVLKIENGTIALIPQVVRFQNPIGRTIEYLNLVSTYEQKYKIQTVSTNLSTIIVAIPPHVELHGNQFVGMTVVYNPQKEQNITESDWSPLKKQSQYFLYRVKKQYESVIFAQVKLITSTELQARSTVIIEKNYKPMVLSSQKEQLDRGVRTMKYILTKRKYKPVRYNEPKQIYQISVKVQNSFPLNLKYKPLLVPQIKFLHLETFFRMYRFSKQEVIQEIFFCVSQKVKAKTRMSVMQVRDIFNLQQVPDQYIMEITNPKGDRPIISMYTFKNQRNETIQIVPNTKTYFYLLKAFENQCKVCYFFLHHQILNRLILSQMLFKILAEEGERTLRQFVRNEIQNFEAVTFFQNETVYSVKTKQSYQQYCHEIPEYSIFRFCDSLNGKVHNVTALDKKKIKQNNDLTFSMSPQEKHLLNIQMINPVDSFKFYLVIANNHTKFQTYQLQIDIKEPSLYVKNGFISPQFSQIYEQSWEKSKGINLLPIQLFLEDYYSEEKVFEGTRIFEIVNAGQTDLFISHIGIDEKEKTCSQKGIIIYGLTCGEEQSQLLIKSPKHNKQTFFTIKSMSKYNLTIKFLLNLKFWPCGKKQLSLLSKQSLRYMIYLYDQKGYHFKLQLIFRIGDADLAQSIEQYINPNNKNTSYCFLALSTISLLFVCLLICTIKPQQGSLQTTPEEKQKAEQDPFRKMLRFKRTTKAAKQKQYLESDSIVGVRLNKKGVEKPVHKVTEDLVLSAKEVTQREFKKYFNQSEQSAIGVLTDMNHHLSLSQSISDHGAHEEPELKEITSQPSQKSSLRSSNLPEGQQVDPTSQIDQDSWYDFNREATNQSNSKSSRNINTSDLNQVDQQEYYNVFRSDISLKKDSWHQKSPKEKQA